MADFFGQVGPIVESIDPDKPHEHPDAAKLDSITLAQFCKDKSGNELVAFLLNSSVRYLLGVEADEISALWFFAYAKAGTGLQNMMSARQGGGQYLRLHEGTQTLSRKLAAELSPKRVRLSSPVSAITHSPDGCTVTTTAGKAFRSRRVIVSIPTPLYRKIDFSPPLPATKQQLSSATFMGFFAKVTLVYSKPWWQDHGLNAIFESALGPVIYSRSTSIPSTNHWSITGFVVGEPGRRWSKLSAEDRKAAVIKQLSHGFGSHIGSEVPAPVEYVEEDWAKRAYFGGGPMPVMGPGAVTGPAKGAWAEPVGPVHFVGSETASAWRGYMEGAVRSGLRGAEEVIAGLKRQTQGGKL
ncbi:Flavin-containing amine oxidase [Macrophomina phaseolina MS6]|uniref:Amine oxidase n=1 Tax=Macrophomina phaseolina (strain MS6) TaxID=1126212 RepID=K2RG57_MACPH|nr:Flavin-containing amine oxidase [Macrophomina phaseolina MS6]